MKEKKTGKKFFPFLLMTCSLILSGCGPSNPYEDDERYLIYLKDVEEGYSLSFEEWLVEYLTVDEDYHKVIFDSNGGSLVEEVIVEHDGLVNEPFVYKLGHSLLGWYKDSEEWNFSSDLVSESITLVANWRQNAEELITELPLVDIDLKGEELENINREDYVDTNISITHSHKGKDIIHEPAEFRGRGHGSWQYDKKGYRIKFNKKQALFGLAKSKHWVLVAGGHDKSLIRNNLAYTITNDVLDNIEYQTSVHEVNLYVNGEYHGVYSLFEQIRVDEDRVNIASEFGILDTGYLIEYNAYAPYEGKKGINYFEIDGLKYPFEMKSPDPDDYEEKGISKREYKDQVEFIQDYVQRVIDAILEEDFATFSRLADVPSFVDAYLIHELFKNTDTGWSSFYLYKKPSGKLYAGPVWDFDYSSGISRGDASYQGLYVGESAQTYSPDSASEIFISLMKQAEFISLFKERIDEKARAIRGSINNYQIKINEYTASYTQDALKWSEGTKRWQTEQNRVFTWLRNRLDWLEEYAA